MRRQIRGRQLDAVMPAGQQPIQPGNPRSPAARQRVLPLLDERRCRRSCPRHRPATTRRLPIAQFWPGGRRADWRLSSRGRDRPRSADRGPVAPAAETERIAADGFRPQRRRPATEGQGRGLGSLWCVLRRLVAAYASEMLARMHVGRRAHRLHHQALLVEKLEIDRRAGLQREAAAPPSASTGTLPSTPRHSDSAATPTAGRRGYGVLVGNRFTTRSSLIRTPGGHAWRLLVDVHHGDRARREDPRPPGGPPGPGWWPRESRAGGDVHTAESGGRQAICGFRYSNSRFPKLSSKYRP